MITTSIYILISKDSGRGLTGLALVILAGTIRKLTIQAERRIMDTSCPLRGEENGMTGLVHILNSIFVKCVVSLRRQWVGFQVHCWSFICFRVKWLYTMRLLQAPGEQRNVHQATEENVRRLMIILSLAQQDKKGDCSDSGIHTSYSMLRTWREQWTRQPRSQGPFSLSLERWREVGEEDLDFKACVGWETSLPPSPYCKLQMLFTVRWRCQN